MIEFSFSFLLQGNSQWFVPHFLAVNEYALEAAMGHRKEVV